MKLLVIENQTTKPNYVYELEGSVLIHDLIYTTDVPYAMELLKNQTFDGLILELVLPGTDGFEILKTIREDSRHQKMKVFIATHMFSDGAIQKAFQMGADHYMIKPVNTAVLLSRITEIKKVYRWVESPIVQDTPVPESVDLDYVIPQLLKRLGTRSNIRGYRYLISCIKIAIKHPELYDQGITKVVYPRVANEFGTKSTRVERAIRHAIEKTWDTGLPEVLDEVFGNTISAEKGRPSNYEFIAGVCEYIRTMKSSKVQ